MLQFNTDKQTSLTLNDTKRTTLFFASKSLILFGPKSFQCWITIKLWNSGETQVSLRLTRDQRSNHWRFGSDSRGQPMLIEE